MTTVYEKAWSTGTDAVWHRGGCHCGAVRFEVRAPERLTVQRCNCSICRLTDYLHLIVPAADFRLLSGHASLTTYTFNTGVAKHLFCSRCGIKPFYVPRSNPDGYSVNLRCLDPGSVAQFEIEDFDGRHWEQNAAALAPLSQKQPDPPGPHAGDESARDAAR